MPKAYAVFVRDSTSDPDGLQTYKAKAGPSFDGHVVNFLATYGKLRVLEGEPVEGAVILEFPSVEEAEAWYFSAAYQDALRHRQDASVYRAFIVEGR